MKVMHLSDLHLGKNILEQSLISDQEYILREIISIIKDKNVDAVLIAGDVYDKGIPSVEAVKLFSYFLAKLYSMRVKVFVIAGNHDSKDRLSFGNELFIDNGVYIEGIFDGSLRSVTLNDEYGELNIYMLPFVKPLSKASVGARISGILGIFKSIGYAFALAVTSVGENMKDGFLNMNNKGRE